MKQVKAFVTAHFNGNHFAIVYDTASGRKNRYTVLQWRVGKQAKVIGRELPLGYAKKLVAGKKPKHQLEHERKI